MTMQNGSTASAGDFTGAVWLFLTRTIVGGWLNLDGSAQSRTGGTAALFAALCPSSAVTMTIASPAVITWTAHPLNIGDVVVFTTTGALPTGITAGKQYYVLSTTTNTFQIALTDGGTAINTSGTQSGTHTAQVFTYGIGDGSTTFNLPDARGRALVGAGTGVKTISIASIASSVITAFGLRANNNEFQTGNPIVFTATTAGNLTNGTTYYVVRISNTSFSLCTNLSDAQNLTNIITLAGTEAGTFALTLSPRTLGDTLGEENHAMNINELLSHVHTTTGTTGSGNGVTHTSPPNAPRTQPVDATGGNAAQNIMQPSLVGFWRIHV